MVILKIPFDCGRFFGLFWIINNINKRLIESIESKEFYGTGTNHCHDVQTKMVSVFSDSGFAS